MEYLNDLIQALGENLLKDGDQANFRNERKKFSEFVETLAIRFPTAVSADRTLNEPYRSLAFLIAVGQRPVTALLILKVLLSAGEKPLNGKKIGEALAERLGVSPELTTKGGNYEDRVGDLVSTFVKIGVVEVVRSDKSAGFRIKSSAEAEVKAFVDCMGSKGGLFQSITASNLEDMFKTRFDRRIKYVVKSGSEQRQRFSIGKILKSLLNPKLGVSFETAIRIVDEVETKLKPGIKTLEIQSILHDALKKYDSKAAENYRLAYPKILSMTMSDGAVKVVNYRLVKNLINKEVKLNLTSNLLDKFASTVYNVITKNPRNYQNETAVREYIVALVNSECMYVRSEANFAGTHLSSATSALEGCSNSLQSDEIKPARELLGQFLEQFSLVTLIQFGYLPFKDFEKNVDLISNLLKQEQLKGELETRFGLDENALFKFQRIKYMMQEKDNANEKSLEKMVGEGRMLIDVSERILQELGKRLRPKPKPKPKPEPVEKPRLVSPSHITTGYQDLDNLLFGGVPKDYAVILMSPSCDERDLLIERFLEEGVQDGQTTFHVTIDASRVKPLAEKFRSNFHLFICNPEADSIIKAQPNVFKLKGVENLTDISIALAAAFNKLDETSVKTRRACIEIVSDVLLQHRTVSTRRWLSALIPTLRSRGFTILAVMNPHMHASQEVEAILDLFQGEIDIYKKKTEKGLRRFLRIEKMYNRRYEESELLLRGEKIRKQKHMS